MKNRFRSSCQELLAKALLLFGILLAFAGAQAQTTITYFHNDSAGTPWLATDQSGNVVWKENYHPYGTPQKNQPSGEGNRLWFGGKPYDADTGLVYMGARYYMPLLGRFTGMDPKEVNPQQIHSFNRYAYANNNPNKYLDPDGKLAETVWDAFNISLGFQSLVSNVREGNWSGAAVDAAGIAVDGVAAAIPVVPGGVGAGIAAYRKIDTVKGGVAVTDDTIRAALKGSDLKTAQYAISKPAVENYVRRLEAGEAAPAIKVDGKVIVDGNHRYVAGRILGKEPAQTAGTLSPGQAAKAQPVQNLKIDPIDWGNR